MRLNNYFLIIDCGTVDLTKCSTCIAQRVATSMKCSRVVTPGDIHASDTLTPGKEWIPLLFSYVLSVFDFLVHFCTTDCDNEYKFLEYLLGKRSSTQ